MANQAYAHINVVQANITDMAGNAAPGGQVLYSAIVLDLTNNVVTQPNTGQPGTAYIANRPINFSVTDVFNLTKVQAAMQTDIRNLYNDQSIQVTFL